MAGSKTGARILAAKKHRQLQACELLSYPHSSGTSGLTSSTIELNQVPDSPRKALVQDLFLTHRPWLLRLEEAELPGKGKRVPWCTFRGSTFCWVGWKTMYSPLGLPHPHLSSSLPMYSPRINSKARAGWQGQLPQALTWGGSGGKAEEYQLLLQTYDYAGGMVAAGSHPGCLAALLRPVQDSYNTFHKG